MKILKAVWKWITEEPVGEGYNAIYHSYNTCPITDVRDIYCGARSECLHCNDDPYRHGPCK